MLRLVKPSKKYEKSFRRAIDDFLCKIRTSQRAKASANHFDEYLAELKLYE